MAELLYNKKLEIKDDKGEIIYTIKNLTLDAEYELENIAYDIQEAKEKALLSNDRFEALGLAELELLSEYYTLLAEDKEKNQTRIDKILKMLKKFDESREKRGKRIIRQKDILRQVPKQNLEDAVRWLKANLEEFKQLSYYEAAIEAANVAESFAQYKAEIKKK